MEKKVFVNVNSDSIQVYGFEKSKNVSFEEKGVRNPQPAIIAILIRECLDELLLSDKDVVIIPGPEYIICSEKITGHVKKTENQENCN
jgi:23S rRNA maturation-related 3'-5' exoribonuclease YhaM